jgi:hypothetical protein
MIVIAAPFAAFGVVAGTAAIRAAMRHEPLQQVLFLGLFALVFGIAGFGLIAAAIASRKGMERMEILRAQNRDAPWMWRPAWASRRIVDQTTTSTVGLWLFALIWNGVSTPILMLVPRELAKGNRLALIGYLFPFVGVILILAAIRSTRSPRRSAGPSVDEWKFRQGMRPSPRPHRSSPGSPATHARTAAIRHRRGFSLAMRWRSVPPRFSAVNME